MTRTSLTSVPAGTTVRAAVVPPMHEDRSLKRLGNRLERQGVAPRALCRHAAALDVKGLVKVENTKP